MKSTTAEILILALVEDYKRGYTQILEHTKLQYQLVGVEVAIAAAASGLWASADPAPRPAAVLLLPPLFCTIVFVQLYLHNTIKQSSRYINFRIRPRAEALISIAGSDPQLLRALWDWEDYYTSSHTLTRWLIRQLGSFIVYFGTIIGIACLVVFLLLSGNRVPDGEVGLFAADATILALTALLTLLVKQANEAWWKAEAEVHQGSEDAAHDA